MAIKRDWKLALIEGKAGALVGNALQSRANIISDRGLFLSRDVYEQKHAGSRSSFRNFQKLSRGDLMCRLVEGLMTVQAVYSQ